MSFFLKRCSRHSLLPLHPGGALLSSFLLCASPGFSQVPAVSPEEAYVSCIAEGTSAIAQRHLTEAVATLNRCKQILPLDARGYFYSGLALAEAGRLSAAAAELAEAVRLNPAPPEYVLAEANVLAGLGHKSEAVKALAAMGTGEELVRLSTGSLWQMEEIYQRLEKTDETLVVLGILEKRAPGDPQIYLERGKAQQIIGDLDKAETSFRKSIELSPTRAAAHFELGKLLAQRNQLPEARVALLEALSRDAKNPEILYQLGQVCLNAGEIDKAIQYLSQAEPAAAVLPRIYYALGTAYQRKGDRVNAAKYIKLHQQQEANRAQRSKEATEHEEQTLLATGEQKIEQGNIREARALFEQVIQLNPENWAAHEYLSEIALDTEEWERALVHLNKLVELDPDSPDANYLMASYWYLNKDYIAARKYAEKARATRPNHADLRNLLGNIYVKLNFRDMAREEYLQALQLEPDRPEFRANLQSLDNPQNR
jgi:Flp pilus assembly protein TadD